MTNRLYMNANITQHIIMLICLSSVSLTLISLNVIDSRVCGKQVQVLLIIALGAAFNLASVLCKVNKY